MVRAEGERPGHEPRGLCRDRSFEDLLAARGVVGPSAKVTKHRSAASIAADLLQHRRMWSASEHEHAVNGHGQEPLVH